jgi:hypothetical protein
MLISRDDAEGGHFTIGATGRSCLLQSVCFLLLHETNLVAEIKSEK